MDAKAIHSIRWVDTDVCLADILTKNSGAGLVDIVMKILRTGNMVNLDNLISSGRTRSGTDRREGLLSILLVKNNTLLDQEGMPTISNICVYL